VRSLQRAGKSVGTKETKLKNREKKVLNSGRRTWEKEISACFGCVLQVLACMWEKAL